MEKKVKILYVDDEWINVRLFSINFSEKYEVLLANDGEEGLEVLKENPDTGVIISDMKMPKMNGIEFINKAKEIFPQKDFFILTGFEITEEIKNALDTGLIREYFQKPLQMKEIVNAINSAII